MSEPGVARVRGGEWSISALADELGLDRRTLNKRLLNVPNRWDPKRNAKLFRLADVIRALSDAPAGDIEDAKTRKAFADAVRAEIAMLRERGEVLVLVDVERELSDMLTAFRAKILGMPDRLAAQLDATRGIDAKRKLLRVACTEAVNELHTDFGDLDRRGPLTVTGEDDPGPGAEEEDSPASAETAARPDAEPVGRRRKKAKPGS